MPIKPTVNRNNLKQTPIPVVSKTMPIVNGDGTVTRSGQLLLEQLQQNTAMEGTAANRPDAGSVPDGTIYVESDRGVAYYNQGGTWYYLAGTMFGSIDNPDQRPTDLGWQDVGFDFRTNSSPAREFMWSGANPNGWIEITPIRYDTHANRLAASLPNLWWGMLWVETDRSEVVYQQQGNTWRYVTGVMWGSLTPDNRPTDLGTYDAGFVYRGTDVQREFIWSGSSWVETSPVLGWVNLTHPNVVTKVSATAGTIMEGGITDASAANSGTVQITAAGEVGIGKAPAYTLDVNGGINGTGLFINGSPVSGGGSGGGAVTSVFTRTGAVVAATGDYNASQVTNAVSIAGSYADPPWITALAWTKIVSPQVVNSISPGALQGGVTLAGGSNISVTQSSQTISIAATGVVPTTRQVIAGTGLSGGGALSADVTLTATALHASGTSHSAGIAPDPGATAGTTRFLREDATWQLPPSAPVTTVFTRTGAVVATTGDYTAAQVTNAVDSTQTYSNPAWISALAWSKITGTPSVGSYQTPWLQNINGGGFSLSNVAGISTGSGATTGYPLVIREGTNQNIIYATISGNAAFQAINDALGAYIPLGYYASTHNFSGNVGMGVAPTYQLQLGSDSAAKPSTNTWTIASDMRTKRNVNRFEGDIEVIRRLDPIVGEYNGKAGTPEGARVVSFDAEKLREILPQAVSSTRGKLHPQDAGETDILGINTHEIFFHMLRAIQQLDREIEELKAKLVAA